MKNLFVGLSLFVALCSCTGSKATDVVTKNIDVVSRQQWGAQPAIVSRPTPIMNVGVGANLVAAENTMPQRGMANYLTVHHTARAASKLPLERNLRSFQQQMFSYSIALDGGRTKSVHLGDIPYHFFIDSSGRVGEGRKLEYAAYSNTIYKNPIEQHITIVLDGNFENSNPTEAQIQALIALLSDLSVRFDIPPDRIGVHSDVAGTDCPGKNLEHRMPDVVAAVRALQ